MTEDRVCPVCGTRFTSKNWRHTYCSRRCKKKAYRKSVTPPPPKPRLFLCICDWCGAEFEVRPPQTFCSKRCSNAARDFKRFVNWRPTVKKDAPAWVLERSDLNMIHHYREELIRISRGEKIRILPNGVKKRFVSLGLIVCKNWKHSHLTEKGWEILNGDGP